MLRESTSVQTDRPETSDPLDDYLAQRMASRLSFRYRRGLPHSPGVFHIPWHHGVMPRRMSAPRPERVACRIERPQPQPYAMVAPRPLSQTGRILRTLEMMSCGIAGGLIGASIMGVPSLTSRAAQFEAAYVFMVPLGAVVGVLGAYLLVWKRWALKSEAEE
ncbi:MAG: hypothetical protein EXR48_04550 [Dehalococcoidia bacterium]|nr:hypothetical protein [Dehalococcoidia bacterium]